MINPTVYQKEKIEFARTFFPWAKQPLMANVNKGSYNNPKWVKEQIGPPMTDEEIMGVCMRCEAWSLNWMDRSQVNIWRDKNGIYVEPAYKVLKNWLDLRGRHSPVIYRRLVGERLKEEGGEPGDFVFEASCYYYNDLEAVAQLRALGIPAQEALNTIIVRGVGVVTKQEASGKYAASKGRAIGDKAKKRAFVDLASEFGSPTQAEFNDMAGMNRGVLPADYRDTTMLALEDAQHLAQARANERAPLLNDEQTADAAGAMFGSYTEVKPSQKAPQPPQNAPEPERPTSAVAIKDQIQARVATLRPVHQDGNPIPFDDEERPEANQLWLYCKRLNQCFPGTKVEQRTMRLLVTWWIFDLAGGGSSKLLSKSQMRAWLREYVDGDNDNVLRDHAAREMAMCHSAALKAAGQMELEEAVQTETEEEEKNGEL